MVLLKPDPIFCPTFERLPKKKLVKKFVKMKRHLPFLTVYSSNLTRFFSKKKKLFWYKKFVKMKFDESYQRQSCLKLHGFGLDRK